MAALSERSGCMPRREESNEVALRRQAKEVKKSFEAVSQQQGGDEN